MRRQLQSRHWLRLHAWLTGLFTLAVMSVLSAALLHAGVRSMGLRYGLVLLAGYGVYLLLVRLWAEAMLRRPWDGAADLLTELPLPRGREAGRPISMESGRGGNFGGGGASGSWGGEAEPLAHAARQAAASSGSADLPPVLEAADFIDGEGLMLPVLLFFGLLLLVFTGMGSLLWVVFGTELFLAVAVEVAFALLMARTLYKVERKGWLQVALRLSWKPVLGALLVAVALGAACDLLLPQADTLAQALRALGAR